MRRKHLIYIRYAFPLMDEPGPKRPLDIVKYFQNKGYQVSVISAGTNFLSGKLRSNFRGRFFIEQNVCQSIRFIKTFGIQNYRTTILRRIISYTQFLVFGFLAGLHKIRIRKDDVILVDVIPPFSAVAAYLLSLFKRTRLALEITDLPETMFILDFVRRPWARRLIQKFFQYLYKRSMSIIVLTPGAKRHIEQQGISPAKIHLIPNWCSDENLLPGAEEIQRFRNEQGWQEKFVVLYAGGFGRAYDLMTMIKSAELLKDKPEICFVLLGEGEKKKEYVNWCRQMKLHNCLFLPGCPRQKLSYFLMASDVCVNLFHKGSFWSRVVGHKIFDYFGHGKPIIFAGEEGDTSRIIRESGGGIVVEPGNVQEFADAVLKLYSNPFEAIKMGQKGMDYIRKNYDKKRILNYLEKVLFGPKNRVRSKNGQIL